MPRRKRNFIQRSRATTYQLVHAPTADNPQHHAFIPSSLQPGEAVPATADSDNPQQSAFQNGAAEAINADGLDSSYKATDFELGEYGFPEDGYNYAKHFRTIGGGGGVYMDALSGMPDPDAVRGSSAAQKFDVPVPTRNAAVALREELERADEGNQRGSAAAGPSQQPKNGAAAADAEAVMAGEDGAAEEELPSWRDPRDEQHRLSAIRDIQRDRKRNADLAAVIDALDSDAELDSGAEPDEGEGDEDEGLSAVFGDDLISDAEHLIKLSEQTLAPLEEPEGFELEDDFVARAAESDEDDADGDADGKRTGLEGVVESYREPRELDAQFERFMQGYDLDVSTDDEVAEYRSTMRAMAGDDDDVEEANMDDVRGLLTAEEIAAMGGDLGGGDGGADIAGGADDLASQLGSLSLFHDGDDAAAGSHGALDDEDDDNLGRPVDASGEAGQYIAAEFDNGMARLLKSYERVNADEAFAAHDGLDVARAAAQRQMDADAARAARKAEEAAEEESDDSELEAHFDELYKEEEEQWDCETILTTYTNLDNHPSVIDDGPPARRRRERESTAASAIIRLDPRTQAPAEAVERGDAASSARDDGVDYGSRRPNAAPDGAGRDKAESKEEKKARKAAVKEAARERRALKSEMKKAFGSEHVKQGRHAAALGKSKVAMQF